MELLELLFQLIYTFFSTFIAMIRTPMVSMLFCIALIIYICKVLKYRATTYYKQTKCSYFKLQRDIGRIGEYHTYLTLRKFEREGAKFLFNVYIPKDDEQTTEIDVLMISKKVFLYLKVKTIVDGYLEARIRRIGIRRYQLVKEEKVQKNIFLILLCRIDCISSV